VPDVYKQASRKSTATGFFDLPRELRDEIYHHLWQVRPIVLISTTEPGLRTLAYYDRKYLEEDVYWFHDVGPPEWLCTNKQIQEEGFDRSRRKGLWAIHMTHDQRLSYTFTKRFLQRSMLMHSCRAHHLHLSFGGYPSRYITNLPTHERQWLMNLMTNICRDNDWRTFRVALDPYIIFGNETITWDLSYLHTHLVAFPHLGKLIFEVKYLTKCSNVADVTEKIYEEVRKLANITLGPSLLEKRHHVSERSFQPSKGTVTMLVKCFEFVRA
jgi:hypothetical protein